MGEDPFTFSDFMAAFEAHANFAFTKINHGFWENLAIAFARFGTPVPPEQRVAADRLLHRDHLFEGGFADELQDMLLRAGAEADPALHMAIGLSAWPGDEQIIGTPHDPKRCVPVLEYFAERLHSHGDGLVLKRAVMDGQILALFERLRDFRVVLVGPAYIQGLIDVAGWSEADFVALHPKAARASRGDAETRLRALLASPTDRGTCVLLQAGTLAPYLVLRLRSEFPRVRWIDGGLALSIACPEDLLKRPWGRVYRRQIVATYRKLGGCEAVAPRDLFVEIASDLERVEREDGRRPPGAVAFVEDKPLDMERAGAFLRPARRRNHWSNWGPAWEMLGRAYERYFQVGEGMQVIPCANGGIALSALANLHAARVGRPLRWVVSAFGFHNTLRGVFADATVVDCDARGRLSLDRLAELDPDTYDGIVVTNPFGLKPNFSDYERLGAQAGKVVLLDNASGIGPRIPGVRYQAFSLHQTKPFGMGEGGLILAPRDDAKLLLALMDYSPLEPELRRYWVGNGKLSELACAALLQRLEAAPEWTPLYEMQSFRISAIAARSGLKPLLPRTVEVVATSLPFLLPQPAPLEQLRNPHFAVGKYYKPLAPLPVVSAIYERLVNIPSHPDMRRVATDDILSAIRGMRSVRKAS
ncbi:MAG: DegT/DnrJ/EryC1/StrS family aminotransferase [Myxococcales bacterium]|nr:DegT/DnrJ/EryC1/StrS family aminotransferase [Myxococcales bacterium]